MQKTDSDNKTSKRFPIGKDIGHSPWVTVNQDMISKFGDATLDPDPMHIDPIWADNNSPYGGTIAFGFLTASLLTHLLHKVVGTSTAWDAAADGYFMNYGIDYLRFISPVPVKSRVRGHFKILDNRMDEKGRNIIKFGCEINIENEDKPALIAEWLTIFMPHDGE